MKITSILKEFREFALKGNVVDMAVGIIIGAAFGKIVTSLVNDVITPPLGIIVGGVDFKDLKFVLKAAKGNAPAVTLNYGNFIQCTIDFIIVAIAIFAVIKAMNALRTLAIKEKKAADEITPPEPTKEEALLTEIRDILKEKNK
ncbi:MAG: large-conductance mechanosensitive channel protein MscL [Bdellovibrionota bacterium]|nr:large-conductance mechanosensitive channel protein MscL [Pseudomonadota bacterium]MDY6090541.1 large-conductance mechanosensitive channel protein MscL [Bdellovibrionota bacterium]